MRALLFSSENIKGAFDTIVSVRQIRSPEKTENMSPSSDNYVP